MSGADKNKLESDVTIVNTGCCHDCGGRCVLRAHIKDGVMVRIETDDGDEVMVFNDRGKTVLQARVTNRIMPGVVSIEEGIDREGNPNMLTMDEHSPGGAYPVNTALVQIQKEMENVSS